ncbi:MAG: ABC transporter permease, partial [Eubacterium sp.]|nr:ABC transporter permease [Eubacterium sp.]
DEQKKQVGTLKALGFKDSRIRVKYLIFGISSAIVGGVLGILLSALLEGAILKTIEDRYSFGKLPVVMSPVVVAILFVTTVIVVYLVVLSACSGLLKCSAVGLISGNEPVQKTRIKARKKVRKRSLYSELILNNIKTDKARVIVGITVIAASGLLMGAGITLKESFGTAFSQQETDIGRYDLKVTFSENTPDTQRDKIEDIINSSGARYAKGYFGGTVYETENGGYGTRMLVMDEKEMPKYFNIGTPPKDGISISANIAKVYGISKGETIKVCGRSLEERDTEVKDTFDYYVGNMLYMSSQQYEKLYGDKCDENCYYVKFDGGDGKALTDKLTKIDEDYAGYICVETTRDETATMESLQAAFDFIAVIFVVLAAALNFLIMINLTNIQVSRRMKELLVMRVNGFSVRQVIGYLIRESLFTTIVGIVLSVAGGIPFSMVLVSAISNTSIMLPDEPSVVAWTLSVLLGALFAFIIDFISFRKVKKVSIIIE